MEKARTQPKVFCVKEIKNIYSKPKREWEIIGRINLVSYLRGNDIPHLEFTIFDEFEQWRGKGIMSTYF